MAAARLRRVWTVFRSSGVRRDGSQSFRQYFEYRQTQHGYKREVRQVKTMWLFIEL